MRNSSKPPRDMDRLDEADVILICVPTPLTSSRDPDLTYVESTTRSDRKTLRPGQLVVLESTTYPGTTRDVLLPILKLPVCTRAKISFWPTVPSGKIRATRISPQAQFPKSSAVWNPTARNWRNCFMKKPSRKSSLSIPAKWPRLARSWKTPIAASISRWSTN